MACVVVISGLFGAPVSPWTLEEQRERYPNSDIIALHPGPVSSAHDRAVECFYMLKGGRVDYGASHSLECGHSRYGKYEAAQLPLWDSDHPIDIIGYSLGATTARHLQHLLITQGFTDLQGNRIPTNGDWIRSIVTLQGVNNGSHVVHGVGLGLDSLHPVRFTILWVIFHVAYIINWIFGEALENLYPVSFGHWKSSRAHGKTLKEVLDFKPLLNDNAGMDLSPKRMHKLNQDLSQTLPHPTTHYVACVSMATTAIFPHESSCHLPSSALLLSFPENLILVPTSIFLGLFGWLMHKLHHPKPQKHEGPLNRTINAHVASDGVVSVLGQMPPQSEPAHQRSYPSFGDLPEKETKGRWLQVDMPEGWNHVESMWYGQKQADFFSEMMDYLMRLD